MAGSLLENSDRPAPDFWRQLAQHSCWDVAAAAQSMGMSLRQFERLCQQELKTTPNHFFQRERMDAAARLLAERWSVKEVAFHLGYTLSANFSRDFKRHFGRRPTAFIPSPFERALSHARTADPLHIKK